MIQPHSLIIQPRSLRFQLILWNALTLTLLLGVLGLVTRFVASEAILSSIDRQLQERTEPSHGPPPRGDHPPDGNHPPDGGHPPRDFRFPESDFRHDGAPGAGYHGPPDEHGLRFFNSQGQSLGTMGVGPWDQAALSAARHGRTGFSTVTTQGVTWRVLTQATPVGYIQAAYPLTEVNRTIAGLDHALLLLIPAALLGAGLAGAALTGRVLRPVRRITEAASAMGDTPSARLPVQGEDEFGQMATTFNGLLSRLDASFRRQAQVLEQQRRFTADASHELKSPLTVIQGTANQIGYGGLSDAESRQAGADIAEAAEHMSRLVRDLLLLARSDEGRLGQDKIEVLVREVLTQAVARVPRVGSPTVLQVSEETLALCGNEDEMIRLFANLLQNAVQATPPDGEILVRARRDGEDVVMEVSDTGSGIAPEHLAHLGERFYRTDFARARRDGGTGLGLSICRGIVQAHSGTLTFASTPGVKTTATVRLPA
jgi:signal transduction histidine kinase